MTEMLMTETIDPMSHDRSAIGMPVERINLLLSRTDAETSKPFRREVRLRNPCLPIPGDIPTRRTAHFSFSSFLR